MLLAGMQIFAVEQKTTGDWEKFYRSLKIEKISKGKKINLQRGEAVRFSGTTDKWCGNTNSGVKVVNGSGYVFDLDPLLVVGMNKDGTYGNVNKQPVRDTSFFVAGYSPTTIEILVTDWKVLGQGCGE